MAAEWVRLSEFVRVSRFAATAREVRGWLSGGIGGKFPPADSARLIRGRWWIRAERFDRWVDSATRPVGFRAEPTSPESRRRVREVLNKYENREG